MAVKIDVTSSKSAHSRASAYSSKTAQVHVEEVPLTPNGEHSIIKQDDIFEAHETLILDPSLITTDFDQLRFEAAAHNQFLGSNHHGPNFSVNQASGFGSSAVSTNLIASPYNNQGHYLDISTLPASSRLFALALSALKPIRADYATAPYIDALNFTAVLKVLRDLAQQENFQWRETSFYVVIFRSQLKADIDVDWLYKLDFESHREACESGGLLKYWFGKSNDERRNLATCFWHSRNDAYKGGLGPWHKKARAAGRELYERIVFSTHRFTILDGARDFVFEDWKE